IAVVDDAPWTRQPDESSPAFQAFALYRDLLGERTTRRVARELGKSNALVMRWSREKDWVKRAEAYDRHLDEKWRQARETELTAMKTRHAEGAGILVAKAMRRLAGHKESGVLPIDENTMDAQDVVRALEVGVKLERLSMGEATDYIRGAHV